MTSNEELIKFIQADIDGKVVQQKTANGWWKSDRWDSHATYRIKPEPREYFIKIYADNSQMAVFETMEDAFEFRINGSEVIKVREVLDDE